MKKYFLASRTVIVNFLMVVVAILGFATGPEFPVQIPAEYAPYALLALALVNVVLRFMTNQPLTLKVGR